MINAAKVVLLVILMLASMSPAAAMHRDILVSDMYYDTFLLDAINDLSVQSGIPIIADSTVSGFVTMEFVDLPLPDALRRLCVPYGFTFRWMPEGYYLVGAADVNNPTFGLLSEIEVFKTNYVPATTVARMLSNFFQPFVKVDEVLNTLVVTGSPEMLQRVASDIARIDTPVRQVIMEVLVVELTDDARRALGTEWHWELTKPKGEPASGALELVVGALRATSSFSYQFPAGIAGFLLSLKPMVESGAASIHANPRIVAMDGHEADIFLGQEQSYIVESETAAGAIVRQRVVIQSGVILNFPPQIAPNGEITVRIAPEVSSTVGFNQDGFPIVSSRRANTTVRVRDGETFVLGGLLHEFESTTVGKVPLLGDIPLLGKLFRTERKEASETEVIIMITPYIIDSEV